MKKYFKIIALFFLGFSIISCEDDGYEDFDAGETAVQEVSGEWYVKFLIDGEDVYGLGYNLLDTYNTADNTEDEMWINDNLNTWAYRVKVPVNIENRTFSGNGLQSSVDDDDDEDTPDYEVEVNINNGKILINEAITEAGNVTDSIYFEAEFSDDPGTIYQVAGFRRTGFLEDEH